MIRSILRARMPGAALGLLLFSTWASGQTGTGEVNGTITDKTGGALGNASVALLNEATDIAVRALTNDNGYFVFLNVHPGTYALTVEAQGFKRAQVPPFTLDVNQTATQNLTLDVGGVAETVTVTGEAPLLQQSSSELGTVISEQAVKDLPLNGRNFTQLMILTPGANPVSTAQGSGISTTDAGVTGIPGTSFYKPSLHGQENRSVLYYLDGITNTDYRGSIYGVLPIVDTIGEFKVEAHDSTAEFGGVTGGIVDVVSRSGGNQIHGSAWEFVRNNAFDARNPFTDFCNAARCGPGSSPLTPAAPIAYHQNEFGVAGGGPVIKNKTFFYSAYEGWRFSKPTLSTALVPTGAELSGDFSQSYYKNAIYNPYTTVCNNGTCMRQPFPNNMIPASLINAPMQQLLKAYLQAPNASGLTGINYVEPRVQTDDANSWMLKIDHRISDKQSLFGRLSQMWVSDVQPVTGSQATAPSNYHAYDFGGGYDYAMRPNLLLDIRAGALLKPYTFANPVATAGTAPAASAGFQNLSQYGGMYVNLAGPYTGSALGNEGMSHRGNPSINTDVGLNWIKGNHDIKVGVEYMYVNRLQNNLYQQFTFADATTSNIGAPNTGNSVASALLGLPASFTAQDPRYAEDYFYSAVWSGYAQDSWKVRRNLTINLGFRYEYLPKLVPLNNRLSNDLNLFTQQYLIGAKSVGACTTPFVDPCIPGGVSSVPYNSNIVFTGQQSAGPQAIADNFGPRAGLAWEFLPKTVLRAGYGIYYDTISARSQYLQNTIEGPTWPWTVGISNQQTNVNSGGVWPGAATSPLTFITNLEGAFPNPVVAPSPWNTNGGGYANDPHYKNPRSQQWNVEIQRQISPNLMIAAAYVGSHDGRLDYTGYANAAPHANPQGTPAATIDAEKLMPFMVPTWHYSQSIGISNYNALEVKIDKRWAKNLSSLLSYTWSKSMDTSSGWFAAENGSGGGGVVQSYFTPGLNYGPSAFNIPQLLTWSTVYEAPFGRGQRWLTHGLLSWILGNWEANYVFLARSGQPFTLTVSGDIANISGNGGTLSSYGRPNLIGDPGGACSVKGANVPSGTEACFFNPAAFAVPSYSFGNFGRDNLHDEPFFNFDFSLLKNIPFGERRALQLRFEGFNVFNFQILGTPGTTIGQSSAGVISSITSTPRQLQMGAKITF